MNKKSDYMIEIRRLLETQRFDEMKAYLIANSNLPGPRGNLELAEAFYSYFNAQTITEELWNFLLELWENNAPTNDPRELLPFCAAEAFANLFSDVNDDKKNVILDKIRLAMNDSRWRMREAAANCCQIIAEKDVEFMKEWILSIYPSANLPEKRGIIAALAHPPILRDRETARFSLQICERVLDDVLKLDSTQLKCEQFAVLKKGLDYAPSVFVSKLPGEGFMMLKKYALLNRKELNSVIKSNLSKSRLQKYYSKEAEEIRALLVK